MKSEEGLKNIIVLRNLPSNLIDEAIIILKEHSQEKVNKDNPKENKYKENKYILDEANLIISEYIQSKNNTNKNLEKEIEKKYKKTKKINTFLLAVSFILLGIAFI